MYLLNKYSSRSLRRFSRNVVQLLSCVWLFATPWTAAHQASLSITISRSLLKLTFIESVMPSDHLNLCCPFFFLPSIFAKSWLFASGGQSIGTSASASVLPMNIWDWFCLGLTGLISLQSKEVPRVFSKNHSSKASIFQRSAFFMVQLSHP